MKNTIGLHAEQVAARYLKNRGLKIIDRNYHSRFGEIDIIMNDGDELVFVEVRCRAQGAQVSAVESISMQKIAKIRKTAHHYMMSYVEMPACRFDVVAMTHMPGKNSYTIDWLINAF